MSIFFFANQRAGATTRLPGAVESQAPHQLNELLAMMKCRQAAIKRRSSWGSLGGL